MKPPRDPRRQFFCQGLTIFQAVGMRGNHLDGFHFSRVGPWHFQVFLELDLDGFWFGFYGS
jgi:hypothetical protein